MRDFWYFAGNIIEKFNIKLLLISVFVVLATMIIPKIDFLKYLMPLDTTEKCIKFIFAILAVYISLCLLIFIYHKVTNRINNKPRKVFWSIKNYSSYINVFLSREICEYSTMPVDFAKYNIPDDAIHKLLENNIIERNPFEHSVYRLNNRARKKLNKYIKFFNFLHNVIDKLDGGKTND